MVTTAPQKDSDRAFALIKEEIERQLLQPADLLSLAPLIESIKQDIDTVLGATKQMSYRDALVLQFAFGLTGALPMDLTVRREGGRTASGMLGRFLETKHIGAVKDAFQNIGKNSASLARGNFQPFDSVLRWASFETTTAEQLRAAFVYTCADLAAKARPAASLPPIRQGALTYAAVCRLLNNLLDQQSGGAFEQFSIAALIHGALEQQGADAFRVETKHLNATDRSSRTSGDVQVLVGGRVIEAIEVTANDWRSKMSAVGATVRAADLTRMTILAAGVADAGNELFDELGNLGIDVSVLELRQFAFSLVAILNKRGRATALERLYELIDRRQPRYELVNDYVAALRSLELCD